VKKPLAMTRLQRRQTLQALAALAGAGALGGTAAAGAPASQAVAAPAVDQSSAAAAAEAAASRDDDRILPQRRLRFPRDHGAHPGARIEWWYATGWLWPPADAQHRPSHGFQLTFFRSRTGLGDVSAGLPTAVAAGLATGSAAASAAAGGRFVPRQLLMAHAAVTDLAASSHRHAQRISRWSGDEALPEAHARRANTAVQLGAWSLQRSARPDGGSRYSAALPAPDAGLDLRLTLDSTQPLLLQGQAGFSRKGPLPAQASHYYSQPQLAVQAQLTLGGRPLALAGTGWLDHEWSDELLASGAVGWDWVGINLLDGGALTAFVLRGRDGAALWAGGSHRSGGGALRVFAPDELQFKPGRVWTSPATGARYPVQWTLRTPAGQHTLLALLDAQELDSRASTGAVYWEGLAELRDSSGARAGLGYLEMTGRASALRLG